MRASVMVVTTILMAASFQRAANATCSEERMRDCESKTLKVFDTYDETTNTHNEFCDKVETDEDCPNYVSDECRKEYPPASAVYIRFMNFVTRWCNGSSLERKNNFKIAHCAMKRQKEYHQCYKVLILQKENVTDCKFYEFLLCLAKMVKEVCNEGNMLAKHMSKSIQAAKHSYCSGCASIVNNHWIHALLTLLSFGMSLKTKH